MRAFSACASELPTPPRTQNTPHGRQESPGDCKNAKNRRQSTPTPQRPRTHADCTLAKQSNPRGPSNSIRGHQFQTADGAAPRPPRGPGSLSVFWLTAHVTLASQAIVTQVPRLHPMLNSGLTVLAHHRLLLRVPGQLSKRL